MRAKRLIKLIVLLVLLVLVGTLALTGFRVGIYNVKPLTKVIKQGLDLRGGVYAVYEADENEENLAEKISGAISVLRNRLDASGYTEATITKQGNDRIRIEVPDIDNPEDLLNIIGSPAKLEFIDPDGNVILTGDHVESAEPGVYSGSNWCVYLKLNGEGADIFGEETSAHVGQIISIRLDGDDISTPVVNEAIMGGECVIQGEMDSEKAQNLAMLIQNGALPLDLEQIEVRTISATLGEDALTRSITAGLIAFALLIIFMIAYYRLPGVAASIALLFYMVIMIILLATIKAVQLTLPGIAGIILSIGMAVDANVIIFERFKEELRAGHNLRTSLSAGFSKAFSAIFDSNLTTLIAAVVLFIFGTGSIKSFALTLLLGILVSMFTALVVTRYLMRTFIELRANKMSFYISPKQLPETAKEAK